MCSISIPGTRVFCNPNSHHILKRQSAMHPHGGVLLGNGRGTDTGRQSSLGVCVSYSCRDKVPWTWHRTQPFYSLVVLQARSPTSELCFLQKLRRRACFWAFASFPGRLESLAGGPSFISRSVAPVSASAITHSLLVHKALSAASSLHTRKDIRSNLGESGGLAHLGILGRITQGKSWPPY